MAVGRQQAYGRSTESSSSVVIKDDTVPGDRKTRSGNWLAASKSRDLMSAFSVSADRLRVETINDRDTTRIVIHGEADIANVDHLKAALDRLHLDGAQTVHLHVSDLTFVDVAALRQLTIFANRVTQAGRIVMTSGAQPTMQRMARELSVQDDLGIHGPGPIP